MGLSICLCSEILGIGGEEEIPVTLLLTFDEVEGETLGFWDCIIR